MVIISLFIIVGSAMFFNNIITQITLEDINACKYEEVFLDQCMKGLSGAKCIELLQINKYKNKCYKD